MYKGLVRYLAGEGTVNVQSRFVHSVGVPPELVSVRGRYALASKELRSGAATAEGGTVWFSVLDRNEER